MIKFTVPGKPVPQGRPRVTHTGHVYYPKESQDYRELVRETAKIRMEGRERLAGPVGVMIEFELQSPPSWTKKKTKAAYDGVWHTSKPDIDNMIKAILDGINGICIDDDSQVAMLTAFKRYGDNPGASVTIIDLREAGNPAWVLAQRKVWWGRR